MPKKIYIVGGYYDYINWMDANPCETIEEADALIFCGGEDINPPLYKKKKHPTTYCNLHRDMEEVKIFKEARKLNKPIIGVCRGAQLLCVLAGGYLVQNQENKSFLHKMKTFDGEEIIVSSTHHQGALIRDLPSTNYKVLGWTENHCSYHEGESYDDELIIGKDVDQREMECVFYPKMNSLGFQPHFEMIYRDYEHPEVKKSINWARKILNDFLEGKL